MTHINSFLKTFFILCSFLLLPTYCSFKFNEDGEFTVLQLTDFHYCETELGDQKTLELQRKLLDIVKPDLVIVSGDAVSGFENRTAGFYENCWKKWTQPFVDTKTYYAYTLGNHDAESDFNRTQIVQLDKTNPYSVLKTAEGIPDTATYRIPIYSSINQSHISTNIWVLDSGSVGCGDDPYSWGCIEKSHVDWYDQESKKFKQQYGPNVHHVAFYHIAIPEYRNAYNEGEVYGGANEGIGCPTVNTGFFSKILENGDISAMFVGHDHKNDFGGWYQGVEFAYGKKSGYGSYGTSRGARIIRFEEMTDGNGQVVVARDHYVIQEDGQILTNKQVKNVGWSRQLFCLPAHGNIFVILKSIGVFHVLINFVLVPVAVLLLWKYVLKKFAKKCVEKIVPRVKYIWTSVMHLFSNYAHF